MRRDVTERMEGWITGSAAVRGAAKALHRPLNKLFQQTVLRPVKLLLNGAWLEHPLHPLLTDVPVGAWTAAIALDLVALIFRVPSLGLASGLTIGLGTLAAMATIVSGVMDWLDVDPPEMAIGAVHALINTLATILFAVSFAWRWGTGWAITLDKFVLTFAAYLIVAGGAFLGGSLVYRLGTMINRNAYRHGPKDFVGVIAAGALKDGLPQRVDIQGSPILLVRRGEAIHALGGMCSHYGAPLEEGKLVGDTIQCPWHYSRFSLADGSVREGPATSPLPAFETRIVDGQVQVRSR